MDAKDIEKRAIINILKQLNSQFTHDTSEANAQKIINYVNENRVYIEEEISNRKSILGFFYIFISIVAIIIAFNSDNEKTFGVVFGITILGGHFVFLFISSW
uniref:hypothetical protein n=1 Tax=Sulfurospirillum cavolei TaxID=366522 RepID=UPI003FA30CFF